MAITYPPVFINEYLAEKVPTLIPNAYNGPLRFFPSLPTDINAITESFPESANDVFGVYDRMFKMRRSSFPHIKEEQLIYNFYKMNSNIEALLETGQIVYDLLDREDESAQELNEWISSQVVNGVVAIAGKEFNPVFFHDLKIYQLEEIADAIDFQTVRTYSGSKMVIAYRYHPLNSFYENTSDVL